MSTWIFGKCHELPVNGRQLSQLYLQAPGAQNTGAGTFGDIRFSGRAVEQNAIRFDGIEGSAIIDASPGNVGGELVSPFRLQSSLENVQEFRVDSNNYPAEYGTGTGGQVSVVTKSGSNDFHGSVFEYLRNDALDARNFFDSTKAPLRMNQFGGSIGGPIIKNKAFFFGSYEGYRLRNNVNFIEAVPNANAKLRAVPSVLPIFDAFRGPGAVTLAGATTDPDFDIVQLSARSTVDEDSFGVRFDYKLSQNHSLYTRFFRDQAKNTQPQSVSGRVLQINAWPQNGVLAFQSMISPTLINEAKFGYNGATTRGEGHAPVLANGIDTSPLTISLTGSIANTGIAGQTGNTGVAVAGGLVRLNSQANGRGAPYTPYTLSFIDNVSWVQGHHNMKFGGEVRLTKIYMNRLGGTTYSYPSLNAFLANTPTNIRFVGDLSDPSLINTGSSGVRKAEQEFYIGYAQDEWKLSPKFTLSYGLRYEYYSPMREANGGDILFDINTGMLKPPDSEFLQGE